MLKETEQVGTVVLLVEDDAAVLALFGRGLQEAGFRVTTAHTAAEALQRAKDLGRIDILATDLILTDGLRLAKHALQRPARDGLELMRRMLELHPNLKVVLFSGQSKERIDDMGVIPPGTVFLRKPFTADTLAWTIRQLLDVPSTPKARQIKGEAKPRAWKLP
jgi:two-component system cell cycle sensor histidine kinase/response regulator CckA